nr:unnamed protein product [Spirometra erinaceieuropaei]
MGLFGHMRIHESGIDHNSDIAATSNISTMPRRTLAPPSHAPTTTTTTTTTTTNTTASSTADTDTADLSCPHCPRTFTSRIGLVGHLRIHRTETGEPVPGAPTHTHCTRVHCPHCPRTFTHRMGLFGHMRIHDDLRWDCTLFNYVAGVADSRRYPPENVHYFLRGDTSELDMRFSPRLSEGKPTLREVRRSLKLTRRVTMLAFLGGMVWFLIFWPVVAFCSPKLTFEKFDILVVGVRIWNLISLVFCVIIPVILTVMERSTPSKMEEIEFQSRHERPLLGAERKKNPLRRFRQAFSRVLL